MQAVAIASRAGIAGLVNQSPLTWIPCRISIRKVRYPSTTAAKNPSIRLATSSCKITTTWLRPPTATCCYRTPHHLVVDRLVHAALRRAIWLTPNSKCVNSSPKDRFASIVRCLSTCPIVLLRSLKVHHAIHRLHVCRRLRQ